jgi:hypothetical protein
VGKIEIIEADIILKETDKQYKFNKNAWYYQSKVNKSDLNKITSFGDMITDNLEKAKSIIKQYLLNNVKNLELTV